MFGGCSPSDDTVDNLVKLLQHWQAHHQHDNSHPYMDNSSPQEKHAIRTSMESTLQKLKQNTGDNVVIQVHGGEAPSRENTIYKSHDTGHVTDYKDIEVRANENHLKDAPSKSNGSCITKTKWKYHSPTPDPDDISANYKSSEAWQAVVGLEDPRGYGFPRFLDMFNNKFYLQIDFQKATMVEAIRIHGSKEGGVTSFFVTYMPYQGGNWSHVATDQYAMQVFHREGVEDVTKTETFTLSHPVKAASMRLYPQAWIDKPVLFLDVYACNLAPYENHDCDMGGSYSLLSQTFLSGYGGYTVSFGHLPDTLKYHNEDTFAEVKFHKTSVVSVHSLIFYTSSSQDPTGPGQDVIALKITYLASTGKWTVIEQQDFDGHRVPMKFLLLPTERDHGAKRKFTFVLEEALTTRILRIYPEDWKGDQPVLTFDVHGC